MYKNSDLAIRDCFVVPYAPERRYYLFSTSVDEAWATPPSGFHVYTGTDLQHWDGPTLAFRPPADFWSDRHYWAPEVYQYQGRYYLFASFKAEDVAHGTQILAGDHPGGPFRPHSAGVVTPREWECLDGTLHVGEDGQPWVVFVHEWMQVGDGEICATRLSADLTHTEGDTTVLFRGSDASWNTTYAGRDHFVTDGPFLYRAKNGELLMLWSSFTRGVYGQGVARSVSGNVLGPWRHDPEPLYSDDGGHGMLFHTFEGQLMLALHHPNRRPYERPLFLPVREENGRLSLER
jgi:arabinan endo-1,5-alpha-L-arabinosidase